MPRIPRLAEPKISEQVPRMPTQDISTAGLTKRALGNVAGAVAGISNDILKARLAAKRQNFVDSNFNDFYLSASSDLAKDKIAYSEDPTNLTDKVREKLNNKVTTYLDAAPDAVSRDLFKQKADSLITDVVEKASTYENQQSAYIYKQNIVKDVDKSIYHFFETPDPESAAERFEFMKLAIEEDKIMLSQEEKNSVISKMRSGIAMSVISGLKDMEQFDKADSLIENNFLGAFDGDEGQKAKEKLVSDMKETLNYKVRLEREDRLKIERDRKIEEDKAVSELVKDTIDGKDATKKARAYLDANIISGRTFRILDNQLLDKAQKEKDERAKFSYLSRLTLEDPDAVRDNLISDVTEGRISAQAGQIILRALDIRKDKEKALELRQSDNRIKSLTFGGPMGVTAKEYRDSLISEKGMSVKEATNTALKSLSLDTEPTRYVSPDNTRDLSLTYKQAARDIFDKQKSGVITKEQAKEEFDRLDQMKAAQEIDKIKVEK